MEMFVAYVHLMLDMKNHPGFIGTLTESPSLGAVAAALTGDGCRWMEMDGDVRSPGVHSLVLFALQAAIHHASQIIRRCTPAHTSIRDALRKTKSRKSVMFHSRKAKKKNEQMNEYLKPSPAFSH